MNEVRFQRYSGNSRTLPYVIDVGQNENCFCRPEQQISLLLNLAQAIQQASDFDTSLAIVMRHICQFTGWSVGQAWYPSPGGEFIECAPTFETDNEALKAFCTANQRKRWRRNETLPGMAWELKKPVWSPGFSSCTNFPHAPLARQLGLKAALAIPVVTEGEVVAILEFLLTTAQPKDKQLIQMFFTVAGQLGPLFLSKRTEAPLRQSEERYHNLIETAHDVIFFLSTDGRIAGVNRAFESVTGWTRSEWLGKHFFPLLHYDDLPTALVRIRATLEGRPYPCSEYRVRKADGTYVVAEFTMVPEVTGGVITGLFGIGRDITARKEAEQAVIKSEEHYRELFQHAYQMQQDLRRLSDRVLRVQEQERTRISRDLHDEVGQSLTAISINLTNLEKNITDPASKVVQQSLLGIRQTLEQTMETVHSFARDLRPAILDDLGLIPALRSYVSSFGQRNGLVARLLIKSAETIEKLNEDGKTTIYRIVQEALNNTAKYAAACEVSVEVTGDVNCVNLTISDNGQGFDVNNRSKSEDFSNHLGLLGMSERARLVNGEFTVESEIGKGTTIRVNIPLKISDPVKTEI